MATESTRGELIDKVVKIRRCAAVVKGGRRFSFTAMVVVGDGQGREGQSLALLVHVPLHQKKSDSQPMRRPVTLPKVPVAACREEPSTCPARFR